MTPEKVRSVLDLYEREVKVAATTFERWGMKSAELEHVLTMIPQMRTFIDEGRMDKTFRWLGFVQGVLYCEGVYTIEQMKNHNRPDEPSQWAKDHPDVAAGFPMGEALRLARLEGDKR